MEDLLNSPNTEDVIMVMAILDQEDINENNIKYFDLWSQIMYGSNWWLKLAKLDPEIQEIYKSLRKKHFKYYNDVKLELRLEGHFPDIFKK